MKKKRGPGNNRRSSNSAAHKKGYFHRLLKAAGNLPAEDWSAVQVHHDNDCALLREKGSCNCYQDILLSRDGGLYEIDTEGRIVPCRKRWNPEAASIITAPRIKNN